MGWVIPDIPELWGSG